MTDQLFSLASGVMLAATSAHPEITPPVDGLGGALGRHVGADGGISAMSDGLGVAAVIVLVLLALAVGRLTSRRTPIER